MTVYGRIAAGIGVADMARSVAFYTVVLGLRRVFQNGDPVIFAILERDAAEWHLLLSHG
jgi:catechol 2,3-dioxygenase-like lactoylglutathione lyase family enzyme